MENRKQPTRRITKRRMLDKSESAGEYETRRFYVRRILDRYPVDIEMMSKASKFREE